MVTWLKIADLIDIFSRKMGGIASWAIIVMVMVQFGVVVMRYIFGMGSLWMQESIIYLHAVSFCLAAGYTLSIEGHVRVDVLYQALSYVQQSWVNLIGTILLLMPFCFVIWFSSFSYVENSWAVMEKSHEATGLPIVFLLKSLILVLSVLLGIQGISLLIRSLAVIFKVHDSRKIAPHHGWSDGDSDASQK